MTLNGLELSTQLLITEAEKRNIKVEILDRQENFIRLSRQGKSELIKQATKTSLDSYVTFLAMENKAVSKLILAEQGLPVPGGGRYDSLEDLLADYSSYRDRNIVVKPNATNFGIGVSMIRRGENHRERYNQAGTEAFRHDSSVLVEELIEGREYRFLVIGSETVAVLRRIPANVTGDGVHTIRELITLKNESPLRGRGYTRPLEQIRTGPEEKAFLALENRSFDTVPSAEETVYLRENSNISTGGDSIDETDAVPLFYREAAVRAAKAAGALICGVDIIIDDLKAPPSDEHYGIIEINFNPALHIHAHPWIGKNREPEKKLLDLLGFRAV